MSHYIVAVIHKEHDDLEGIMEPYYEERETSRYMKHTKAELIQIGKDNIKETEGNLYAKYLKDPKKYEENCKNESHLKYLKEEFPLKLKWNDEEIYQEQVKFYKPEDIGKDGEIYSTYNPNSKWDWYVVGGRWRNSLKLVAGKEQMMRGENGVNDTPALSLYSSQILFSLPNSLVERAVGENNTYHAVIPTTNSTKTKKTNELIMLYFSQIQLPLA